MSNDIKTMTVEEFWKEGYLQEVNRQFFHPLGIALSIIFDDDNNIIFGEIWDYRNDPEGIRFANPKDDDQLKERIRKATNIENLYQNHVDARIKLMGSVIQPISVDEQDDPQLPLDFD